ncbi:MAG TPA: hypothetical protein VHL98_13345 [Microvirga sp.]|jgi:hypothetical protein|nr:hypothetical protein [Microvirga sp.]
MSCPDPVRPDPEPPLDVEGLSKLGAMLTAAVGVPGVLFMIAKSGLLAGVCIAVGVVGSWIKLRQALVATSEAMQSGRRRGVPETIVMAALVLALLWMAWGTIAAR